MTGFAQSSIINVRAGEAKISLQAKTDFVAENLGCGLALAACDPIRHIGGLLYALLPHASLDEAKSDSLPSIFVDSGILHFLQTFRKMKVDVRGLEFKLVGGVDLLENDSIIQIGRENIQAAREVLQSEGIQIKGEILGGNIPLTIATRLLTGQVVVSLHGYDDIIYESSRSHVEGKPTRRRPGGGVQINSVAEASTA